jgi:hypothetical protein
MNDGVLKVRSITNRLLATGNRLLQRLNNLSVPDSQLPKDIAVWVCEVTDQVLPLMPEDCQDYSELNLIRNQYTTNQSVLLPSAASDIRKMCENLHIAYECVCAAFSTDSSKIPPQKLAEISYIDIISSLDEVDKSQLIQHLQGKENGRTCKTAILNIYGKIYLWIRSIAKLNKPEDCLALAGAVRAILELYVDLNLLARNLVQDAAEKFFSFPDIEKWRVAKKIVDGRKQFSTSIPQQPTPSDKYLENNKTDIEAIQIKLWGKDKKEKPIMPKSWSNSSLWQRVVLLQDKEILDVYFNSYYYCNWCVHSIYNEFLGKLENIDLFNGHLYGLAKQMFLSATKVVNKEITALSKDVFQSMMDNIEKKSFKRFFGELVKNGRNSK